MNRDLIFSIMTDPIRRVIFELAKKESRENAPKYRRSIMRRCGGRCECCNLLCGDILHLHHVYRVADGGEASRQNLIALCPNCHAFAHRMREARVESDRLKELYQLAANYAGEGGGDLLLGLSCSDAMFDFGLKRWRRTKSSLEKNMRMIQATKALLSWTDEEIEMILDVASDLDVKRAA